MKFNRENYIKMHQQWRKEGIFDRWYDKMCEGIGKVDKKENYYKDSLFNQKTQNFIKKFQSELDLNNNGNIVTDSNGKPITYLCNYVGCKKGFTSSYGLRYHLEHGHTMAKNAEQRPYRCFIPNCVKSYKNSNGLKYHLNKFHNIDTDKERERKKKE
ncbi:Z394 [Hepatospora eriocheir]|uniref:Z394 n=1 Tax=Hepatospora eriocheir TaxID=1081669 RepID=A0A1X0QFR6_9MICR|nr:Z394 [Hepatospora eriocheir]